MRLENPECARAMRLNVLGLLLVDRSAVPDFPGAGHAEQGNLAGSGGDARLAALLPSLVRQAHL